MFYKVKSVSPLSGFKLLVQFENGATQKYDVEPLFSKWPVFHALREVEGLFELVKVDAGGYGISWNDDLDLSCNELWENGFSAEQ
ncbi:MAG: DUF2442 domain-containing protein [Firmicutes bacterium]|nr:DUF2442 domain-containing protein [Bacillota bacterium]